MDDPAELARQLEMMRTLDERMEARTRRLMSDPLVRRAFMKPAPGQREAMAAAAIHADEPEDPNPTTSEYKALPPLKVAV